MNEPMSKPAKVALVLVSLALLALLVIGLTDVGYTQKLFVHTTYFFLMATVLCWAGTYLHGGRDVRQETIVAWAKANWPGLVIAAVVTVVAWLAIHPALRILSDEANLVGTSKNLFASRAATFTVSGKNYYDSYWDIDVAIDRRPALFPFLVSLVHVVRGYSYENAFLFNLLLLPAFVLLSYRLAKSLGGDTCGIVASLLVVAHPITLIAVRSGGFDFFAVFFSLLVIKSLLDHLREPSAARLAILWMNLCMFAEIRYESGLFILPVVALLFVFRLVNWSLLRPYAFIYALTPAYLLPRIWQAVLRGSVPEQDPGAIAFSLENFFNNAREYFKPVLSPLNEYPAHSGIVIALGLVGCVLWLGWHRREVFAPDWKDPRLRFAAFLSSCMLLQVVVVFSYVWGRAQAPSAARLVIAVDTFFSFFAAWALTVSLRRWRPFVAVLIAAAVLAIHVPIAGQHRFLNRLTQTRETATAWRFFESLHEKRILIVTDRPDLFTIMDYGAMSFEAARQDPFIFEAFARHLFYDIYVVQQIRLSTNSPLPGYDIWPTRRLETMLEYQNDADVLIRISRLGH
jgi:4-amino-4-deoxy-L-arabinose transferase-like glycosyltransferase